MMPTDPEPDDDVYRFPEFLEQLTERGALRMRDAVETHTEIDGLLYHHRGVQVPARSATFLWDADRSAGGTIALDVEGVGGRRAWIEFDATAAWDVYLALYQTGAVVAWMTDDEFEREESDVFPSKAEAIRAGRFSFGALFLVGPDWIEREDWATSSTAPALVQLGDGRVLDPATEEEYDELTAAIPEELRPEPHDPPAYLGVRKATIEGPA